MWNLVRGGQYRLVGDDDETFYVTTTLRAYNAVLDRWELIGMDGVSGCTTRAPAATSATRSTSSRRSGS